MGKIIKIREQKRIVLFERKNYKNLKKMMKKIKKHDIIK